MLLNKQSLVQQNSVMHSTQQVLVYACLETIALEPMSYTLKARQYAQNVARKVIMQPNAQMQYFAIIVRKKDTDQNTVCSGIKQ